MSFRSKFTNLKLRYSKYILVLTIPLLLLGIATSKRANAQDSTGFNIELSPAKSNLNLEPGTSNTKTFRVGNYSGSKRELFLYVRDFTVINELGTPTFIENEGEVSEKYSLRDWVKLPYESIELENDEVAEVEVTIDVPANAEPGGHYGAFFVQTKKPESQGTAIGSIGRFASLLLVNIPGDVDEEIVFTQVYTNKPIYWESNPKIEFVTFLKNNGSVHGVPIGAFNISEGYGYKNKSFTYNKAQGAVLPGAPERKISEKFGMERKGLVPPIGKFKLELIARYGTENFPLETTHYFWLLPLNFIIMVVLLILFALFVVWRTMVSFKK